MWTSILKSKFISLLFISCVLLGCASKEQTLPSATIHASLTTSIQDYKYLIGPGDSLNIFVWRNPEISGTFLVRPDGMITTSLVEDIPVSGRTPSQLARELEQALSTYIRDPIVSVMVSGFIGPYAEQIRVIGEALEPKAVNYNQHMTLLDLMVAVGGLTDFADGDDATLIRVVDGKQTQFNVKLDSLIRDGNINANVDVLPGDVLIIPEAWF